MNFILPFCVSHHVLYCLKGFLDKNSYVVVHGKMFQTNAFSTGTCLLHVVFSAFFHALQHTKRYFLTRNSFNEYLLQNYFCSNISSCCFISAEDLGLAELSEV